MVVVYISDVGVYGKSILAHVMTLGATRALTSFLLVEAVTRKTYYLFLWSSSSGFKEEREVG